MIRLLNKVPEGAYIYVDGGYKGFVLADFIFNVKEINLFHVVKDNSERSLASLKMVGNFSTSRGLKLSIATITEDTKGNTPEEKMINTLNGFGKIIATPESIEDAMVFYLEQCIKGTPQSMPYRRTRIIRPFLLNKNKDILKYAYDKGIPFLDEDQDTSEKQNQLIKLAMQSNPDFYKETQDKLIFANLLT